MVVKSAAGKYSAGCSYTCETSTASINYCTSSYCNADTVVSTAASNYFVFFVRYFLFIFLSKKKAMSLRVTMLITIPI